ncbi:MAG: DUF6899 family protein [Candidatus Helarchaeota archaeon]
MPYINSQNDRRKKLREGDIARNAGELNFQMFAYIKECLVYKKKIDSNVIYQYAVNFIGENPNYQKYNDLTGAFVRCYKEIKRRLDYNVKEMFCETLDLFDKEIADYEDLKISSNGDVSVED